ncbi:peptidoglycan-associated outer membrane lipoprotein [Botrimarina colliarenosi]|uniref:Peptidoglycan-associated outer membrane lipoprotein n=1 Tax=Botrimarina colliarenosi TaxID=2528001 RepID=A0A5C6A645_9BACT|nr:phosphate ABC transporter substrate-binding/OmpA family protein [Botrimarina colliarenosi]TWT94817.1 peptidoglycan-associated outer membrane lipoprotein [Botrimarina colliarenosi]
MSKGKLLAVAIVWLVILGMGAGVWRFVFAPVVEKTQAEREAQERQRGGSESLYRTQVKLALDGFSGYAVLRSPEFAEGMRKAGVRLTITDDGADYPARLAALRRGDADMAVFTIDALVKACAEAGALPATIVAMIDETVGADAIVANRETFPNIDALNHPDTRFVLTPDSPSETLSRVVMSRFQLDQLPENPFVPVKDAAAVVARYKASRPVDRLAYVLWEPLVTQVLKNEKMHVVVDSSRFPSAIADVLVASDDFVAKNRGAVVDVVKAYFQANYAYRDEAARVALVQKDAAKGGARLTDEEAERLVNGVWWKNTRENLAHMGKAPGSQLPLLEDMIASITAVLIETGAIESDPTDGNPNYLYLASVWNDLADFQPGATDEQVRGVQLPALSDEQWNSLVAAGTARAPTLVFARGTDRLTGRSQSLLDELAGVLGSTRYYVTVRGNASRRGDLEANKRLAAQRAKAVEGYLVGRGVDKDRIRAIGVEPSGETSVTFVLGEPSY